MIKMEGAQAVTPKTALEKFQKESPDFILEQVKLFNGLGLSDRMELLFFLIQNQALTVASIGAAVQLMVRNKKGDN